jgi:GNAT superfamily N-acetyltransferase
MSEQIATAVPGLRLRFAQPDDVPQVLRFVRELAEFERLADQVTADEVALERALFGPHRFAEAVVARYRDADRGFALFFHTFSTFAGQPGLYLEDLYVEPEARGRGIGSELLRYLGRLALERGCARLELAVLHWNQPAIRLYRRLGAEPLDDWLVHRISGPALAALAAPVNA